MVIESDSDNDDLVKAMEEIDRIKNNVTPKQSDANNQSRKKAPSNVPEVYQKSQTKNLV